MYKSTRVQGYKGRRVGTLLLLYFCTLLPSIADAAPTHDATTTFTASAASTVGGSHTRGGGCTSPIAYISVAWQASSPTALSSVTYGGSAATLQAGVDLPGGGVRLEVWTYKNPASGAATVTATLAGTVNSLTERVSTYCGVDQTASYGTPVTATGSDTLITLDVTSATGELVVDAAVVSNTGTTITVGAGQTQRANFYQDIANHVHGGSEKTGATSVNMSWNVALADYWAGIALPLRAVATAGGTTKRKIIIVM